MAQSGEGKPRVVIAGVGVAAGGTRHKGDAADASFMSEVVEPMRAGVASLRAPACLAGTAIGDNRSGRGDQHGCR